MAVLSDGTIKKLQAAGKLGINPFLEDGLQPATYDMRLFWKILVSPTRLEQGHIVDLRKEPQESYDVEPGRFVGVLTEEVLTMPADISARFGLRSEFTRHGLVAFGGIQVDPGFRGRLAISLFNAGPEPIPMEHGRKMFTVEFQSLDEPALRPYSGEYQNLEDFSPVQEHSILNAHTVSMSEIAQFPRDLMSLEIRVENLEQKTLPDDDFLSVEQLATEQGVTPSEELREFEGGWPDDEDVEEFLIARRRGDL